MPGRSMVPAIVVALGAAPATFAAETYQLEKTHVDLLFSVNHLGFTEKHGAFHDLDATLQYDAAHPEKSVVSVTVKTDSLDTAFGTRDQDLKRTNYSLSRNIRK